MQEGWGWGQHTWLGLRWWRRRPLPMLSVSSVEWGDGGWRAPCSVRGRSGAAEAVMGAACCDAAVRPHLYPQQCMQAGGMQVAATGRCRQHTYGTRCSAAALLKRAGCRMQDAAPQSTAVYRVNILASAVLRPKSW